MANEGNLRPTRDPETARALGRKGGKASGESRRRKANLRKAANDILANNKVSVEGEDGSKMEVTAEEAMILAMLKKAVAGDVGAYKALMSTVGLSGKSDLEEKEQKLRIKELELKQELYEDAKKRAEAASEVSEVDDGFLAALGATAVNDWAQD